MGVIREKRTAIGPRPVGVIRPDTGAVDKYSRIADAQSQLTSLAITKLGETAIKEAEAEAQALDSDKITSINPVTGKPEALDFLTKNAFLGAKANAAFERVVKERFQNEIENEIKQRAGEIALKFENDPYSVEKYEDQMNSYLKDLAANSEQNGNATEYTNFIVTQGAQYVTATTLSMMQERKRRERAKVASSHVNQNLAQTNDAYELGAALNFKNFDLMLKAGVERNQDLEDSNLFQSGAAVAHGSQMREQFVNGVVQQMLFSATPLQRAKIIDALQRGNSGSLHAGSKKVFNKLIKYVDSSNKAGVLSNAKQVNANLRAIQVEKDAADLDVIKQAKVGLLDGFINDGDAFASGAFNSITEAYNVDDPSKLELAVKDAVQQAQAEILRIQNASDELLTADQKQFLARDIRQGAIEPLLAIAVRSDPNNATDLALAINNNDSDAFGRLNEFQASIVEGLRSPDFPMTRDDVGFVASFLAGSVNEVQRNIDNYYARSEFDNGVTEFIKNEKAGIENEQDINDLVDQINASTVHTGPQKDALKNRLRLGFAYAEMNKFDRPTSISLNALQQYLATEGQQDLGLTETQKLTADEILSFMTDENENRILSEVGSRQANARTQELADEAAQTAFEEARQLAIEARSGGTIKTKKHREHIDEVVFPKLGIDIFSPDSETEELYSVLRNTMSQQFVDTLRGIVSGTQVMDEGTVNVMLNHFARMRYDVDVSGTINRFGDLLTGEEMGILEDAIAIRNMATGTTKPISEIIVDLKNRVTTDEAKEAYRVAFQQDKVKDSGNTPAYDFIYKITNDVRMTNELEPIVEYYAKTGRTRSQIVELLNDIIDTNYATSEYIVDPSMPPSMMTKSRHALALVYPDKEERDEFLRIIQSNLPQGFVLASTKGVKATQESQGMQRFIEETVSGEAGIQRREETRVFLVPYGPTQAPQYYTYFQDNETKELRPLIIDVPSPRSAEDRIRSNTSQPSSELTWPMFDGQTTDAWRERKAAEEEAKAKKKVEQNQATFQELNKEAQKTPFGRSLSRSILGGL
jgi:hypothetical protein